MIKPARVDLPATRNGDLRTTVTLSDDAGAAIDLTGFHARLQVRARPGAEGEALVSISDQQETANGSGITIIDAAAGQLEIFIDKADWAAIPPVTEPQALLAWDLVLTEPGGDEDPYLGGQLIFREGVTR